MKKRDSKAAALFHLYFENVSEQRNLRF